MPSAKSYPMKLTQLRYFVVLAEELSFTRAAERLHISQPPLSQQIAQLEENIGVKLFNRTSRRVELTEPGELFLREVRITLDRLRNAASRARAVDRGVAGRIEVGLSGSHFLGPLPKVMANYALTHPDVAIMLNELKPADQIPALLERRIDVSISRVPLNDNVLRSLPLWPDPPVVALTRNHRLTTSKSLKIADLKHEKLVVLRRETSVFAQLIYERCSQAGFVPNIVQMVEEVPAQVHLVAAGLGVAIVPLSVCLHNQGIESCPLDEPGISTDVFAVLRRDTKKRVLDAFLDIAATLGEPKSTHPIPQD